MQRSKSFGSFLHPDGIESSLSRRSRSQTFSEAHLTSNRARVPSLKTELIDLEIAADLLHRDMRRGAGVSPSALDGEKTPRRRAPRSHLASTSQLWYPDYPSPESEDRSWTDDQLRQMYTPSQQRLVRRRGRPVVIMHKQSVPRSAREGSGDPLLAQSDPFRTTENPHEEHHYGYDGHHGSSLESRVTSMSWSSISHRLRTTSSSSSMSPIGMDTLDLLAQYNDLAVRSGLQRMKRRPGDVEDVTETTEKSRHSGWFRRKFLGHSSQTVTIESKTAPKAIKRKVSMAMMGGLLSGSGDRKNLLVDKTLEEMGRLGGLGTCVLPPAFAMDKLLLPTSLAAISTYLYQHATNTPGLFRIPGQAVIINQIYEFFAYRSHEAGSPSKVDKTISQNTLPTHIDFSIHDVGSLYKKLIASIPGGILGTVELFNALHTIVTQLSSDTSISDSESDISKAKLIALIVSCVASPYRVYLIHATFGLIAYFGNEAEKARIEWRDAPKDAMGKDPSSEFMGFAALSRVFGPLLLCELADGIDVSPAAAERISRKSSDGGKKTSKRQQKRNSVPSKLDRNAELQAGVERANLMADVLEQLLRNWKEVVIQLRKIQAAGSKIATQPRGKAPKGTEMSYSKLFLPEEDAEFMNMLRGRSLPRDWQGEIITKRKVRISSRSPRPRGRYVSEDSMPTTVDSRVSTEGISKGGNDTLQDGTIQNSPERILQSNENVLQSSHDHGHASGEPSDRLKREHQTQSEIAMEQMAMGTILQPPMPGAARDSRYNQSHSAPAAHAQSHLRDCSTSDHMHDQSSIEQLRQTLSHLEPPLTQGTADGKPLPEIGDAQLAERSSVLSATSDQNPAPPEQIASSAHHSSQLATNKQLPPRPNDRTYGFGIGRAFKASESRTSLKVGSRKASSSAAESNNSSGESRSSSLKTFTQRIADLSRLHRRGNEKDGHPIQVLAQIKDVESPAPQFLQSESPLISPKSLSPGRTLIPKPTQDVGSARKLISRTPSPPKRSPPVPETRKSHSVSSLTTVQHAEPEGPQTANGPPSLVADADANQQTGTKEQRKTRASEPRKQSSQHLGVAPTRPLSTYSSDSLRRMQVEEDPPVAQHIHSANRRIRSFDVGYNVDRKQTMQRDSVQDTDRDTLSPLQRTGTTNTTLLTEIARLKRLLEQKSADLHSAKRTLDAVRDAREVIDPDVLPSLEHLAGSSEAQLSALRSGSVKGTLSEEMRVARKEKNQWKKRAEWAESRLAAMETGKGDESERNSDGQETKIADQQRQNGDV